MAASACFLALFKETIPLGEVEALGIKESAISSWSGEMVLDEAFLSGLLGALAMVDGSKSPVILAAGSWEGIFEDDACAMSSIACPGFGSPILERPCLALDKPAPPAANKPPLAPDMPASNATSATVVSVPSRNAPPAPTPAFITASLAVYLAKPLAPSEANLAPRYAEPIGTIVVATSMELPAALRSLSNVPLSSLPPVNSPSLLYSSLVRLINSSLDIFPES